MPKAENLSRIFDPVHWRHASLESILIEDPSPAGPFLPRKGVGEQGADSTAAPGGDFSTHPLNDAGGRAHRCPKPYKLGPATSHSRQSPRRHFVAKAWRLVSGTSACLNVFLFFFFSSSFSLSTQEHGFAGYACPVSVLHQRRPRTARAESFTPTVECSWCAAIPHPCSKHRRQKSQVHSPGANSSNCEGAIGMEKSERPEPFLHLPSGAGTT